MTGGAASADTAGRGGARPFAGAVLALVGLLVFHLSVIAVAPAQTVGKAAAPWPDGAEYLDAAVSLAHEGTYRIHLAGESHPPRYPFGYSLLIAGAIAAGVEPEAAPHRVNQIAGLGLLGLVAWPLWRRGRHLESGLAILLLATLPAFIILCRSPLSEISSTLLIVGSLWLLAAYAGGGPVRRGAAGAALLGLTACFRLSNVLLLAFLPAAAAARHGLRWRRPATREAAILGTAAAAGLLPLLAYNVATFGDLLASGYGYWAPYWDARRAFDSRFLSNNLFYYWRELSEQESTFTTAHLFGHGSYFGPAFAALALGSPLALRARPRRWPFAAAGLLYAGAMGFYFFTDARLLFPLMVVAIPVAAIVCVDLWRRPRRRALALATSCLCAAAVLGWPGAGGRSNTLELLRPASDARPAAAYQVMRQLRRLHDPDPGLILTELPPPYAHAVLPAGVDVAPLFDDHLFRFNPRVFVYGRDQRRRQIAGALAAGRSVWAVTHARSILDVADGPAPAGYVWEIVARDRGGGGIARLVAAADTGVIGVPAESYEP